MSGRLAVAADNAANVLAGAFMKTTTGLLQGFVIWSSRPPPPSWFGKKLASPRNIRAALPVERALIDALAKRYPNPQAEDRTPLDRAYADAMHEVWKTFPKDPDVGAFFAEAIMDLRPWDQWTPEVSRT
jgi:hypothetical protein